MVMVLREARISNKTMLQLEEDNGVQHTKLHRPVNTVPGKELSDDGDTGVQVPRVGAFQRIDKGLHR